MSVTDFTGIIDNAVLNGVVDIGVHSLKDLPPLKRWHESITGTSTHHNLKIAAYLPRTTPMDILIGSSSITNIPLNARVGTSSTRRQAQLLNQRPDLSLVNLRGNVQARIDAWKDGTVDALILAQSGIDRLGIPLIGDDGIEYEYCQLTPKDMIPAPGQGIVGVVCRSDNYEILDILKTSNVDDWTSRIIATAELSCLNQVDGFASYKSGGRPPIGAYMEFMPQSEQYVFRAMLARPDGKRVVKLERIISVHDCATEESAYTFGLEIGKSLMELAGHDFWDGYENDTLNEVRRE
jgi:hydroxymethylbilane synthase